MLRNMRSLKVVHRSALLITALATFSACGGKGDKPADAAAGATPAGGKTFTIAMIAKSSTNPVSP
jgi:predicted small lipoprotein YifL